MSGVAGTLAQKTVLITGAARGIGAGIASRLAAENARIGVVDVDGAGAEARAEALRATGAQAASACCDVANAESFRAATETICASLGSIDILVNNAGWSPNKPFLDMTQREWSDVIAINYVGVLNGCRLVLDDMVARRAGRIVNISSDAARVGTPRESVYAGAKAAVVGFSKSLAAEVARYDITVNVVCPGTTDTQLLRSMLSEEQLQRRRKANPMGRIGRPEDVAAAVAFFASDAAAYITGQVLSVNGGISRVG